jgi:HK97 gp10 family phage protein
MDVSIRVEGVDALLMQLERLAGPKVAKKLTRKALRNASTPVLRAVRKAVPVAASPHLVDRQMVRSRLKRSIGRKFKYYKATKTDMVIIGPRRSKKWDSRHAWWTEEGTVRRFRKSGGTTGAMPATPWLEPTFRRTAPRALATMRKLMAAAVVHEATKGRKAVAA